MVQETTKSHSALQFITDAINAGKTILLASGMYRCKITPKTWASWEKSGHKLFKIGKDGCLYIVSGKNYNKICTPDICLVQIIAQ